VRVKPSFLKESFNTTFKDLQGTQTMPVEVTRVDPVVALLSFIAGLALAGVPLVVILIRRAGGGE
jgi:hypothetical protein